MEFTYRNTVTAIHAAIGIDGSLAVSHSDGFGGADPNTSGTSGAVIFQNLNSVEIFTIFSVHFSN